MQQENENLKKEKNSLEFDLNNLKFAAFQNNSKFFIFVK
jgi:hypothetical protein